MAIITISRGSYSEGKHVAKMVAEKLGYRCIAREVILSASEAFDIPEIKFARAIHDAPSFWDKFTYGKEKYVAYFQLAFLNSLQADNVVYHGLAGHFFIKDISHALKVRIIADIEDRAKVRMKREGISRGKALSAIMKDDEERRKWSLHLYGIDTTDPSLYDLIVHIKKMSVIDAADIICHAARLEIFKATDESRAAMDDLVVAAGVKVALIGLRSDIEVYARQGKVIVETRLTLSEEQGVAREIVRIARSFPGVETVELKPSYTVDWSD